MLKTFNHMQSSCTILGSKYAYKNCNKYSCKISAIKFKSRYFYTKNLMKTNV